MARSGSHAGRTLLCWFENIRPVRGEQEEDIGIVRQPVHLIEQFKEQHVAPRILFGTLFRDQVNILEDDGSRLQQPCHCARAFKQSDTTSGEQ